jgi:hypothetical protein
VLKWTGTTWAPGTDISGGFTLPYTGTASNAGYAFSVTNSSNTAILGYTTAASGSYFGLYGQSDAIGGRGVWGYSTATTGSTVGVGAGVNSTDGIALRGIASASTGTTYGVKVSVTSANGFSGYFTGGKFYVSGNVGIGTSNPGATLDVEGSMVVGSSGKVFTEIRELTGTTASSGTITTINYPSGYNMDNTRVLSCEIKFNNNQWQAMGLYYTGLEGNIGCSLRTTNIAVYFPAIAYYWSMPFRLLLMKVQ